MFSSREQNTSIIMSSPKLAVWQPCYLLPVTCYLLPVTCYLLPVTCYLLPATCYLLPVTCYLLPATCYLLRRLALNERDRHRAWAVRAEHKGLLNVRCLGRASNEGSEIIF